MCSGADDFCDTPFTGPLAFGDMRAGDTKVVNLHIKNTAEPPAGGTPRSSSLSTAGYGSTQIRVVSGDVSSLGHFLIRQFTPNGSERHFDDDLDPGEVRRPAITFIAEAGLAVQALNFDILIDSVDLVE